MRGKLKGDVSGALDHRNIPAYAGKTRSHAGSVLCAAEHPRVCGENPVTCAQSCSGRGTSPRMRGKQITITIPPVDCRNIPAYAGKTAKWEGDKKPIQEHPRVCGENFPLRNLSVGERGTSPRMRGKPHPHVGLVLGVRNIPAYAGKTIAGTYIWRPLAEHPRVCGENADNVVMPVFNAGTSPRARGKRPKAHRGRLVGRNIPACAGKTLQKPSS